MLERVKQLAVEIAKWEAEEKERARLEALRAARQQAAGGAGAAGPNRPLMIRTGKAKTGGACGGGAWRLGRGRSARACRGAPRAHPVRPCAPGALATRSSCPRPPKHSLPNPPTHPLWPTTDGTRIVLKCMGKEPFPPARGAGAVDSVCGEEQVAQCRWGYQCSVCLLAGDLLCCEVRRGAQRGAGRGGWRVRGGGAARSRSSANRAAWAWADPTSFHAPPAPCSTPRCAA